jgi:hypothetical protein
VEDKNDMYMLVNSQIIKTKSDSCRKSVIFQEYNFTQSNKASLMLIIINILGSICTVMILHLLSLGQKTFVDVFLFTGINSILDQQYQ